MEPFPSTSLASPRDAECPVALEHDVALHAAEVRGRLSELMDRISDGAPLPAQGVEAVCAYCEMHGLCRRRHWS